MVRSQLDYGIPIINYHDYEIKKMEEMQEKAIKQLLKIDYNTAYHTMLTVLNIPTIKHRIDTMKLCFWFKIREEKEHSMAHTVCTEMMKNMSIMPEHSDRLSR